MGRLIDADKLKVYLQEYLGYGHAVHWVDAQPTAYDISKVVEELEELKEKSLSSYDYETMKIVIDIARKGGVE